MRRSAYALALLAFPALLAFLALPGADPARAEEHAALDADTIARKVYEREEGTSTRQKMTMRLINRSGTVRTRDTRVLRVLDDEMRRTVIYFESPTNVKGTAFLNYDYLDSARTDDRWLYLPAMRRVRRISAADRGDYFLGTDLTYQDIQDSTKFPLEDYAFEKAGVETVDDIECVLLRITPHTDQISEELGYSRILARINPANWMPMKAEYWDTNDNRLKTISLEDQAVIQGIWTAQRIIAVNHKTGHRTELIYDDVAYNVQIEERQLTPSALRRML